jgi:hypothetical protein
LSLGSNLYELVEQNHLFEKNLTELMKKIMNERASKASSKYSDKLKNLASKILNKPNLRSKIYEIMETTI